MPQCPRENSPMKQVGNKYVCKCGYEQEITPPAGDALTTMESMNKARSKSNDKNEPQVGERDNIMPLGKNVSKNISELYKDNKKKGKARGANGKVRSRKQIIAISLRAAGKSKKSNKKVR